MGGKIKKISNIRHFPDSSLCQNKVSIFTTASKKEEGRLEGGKKEEGAFQSKE